MLPKCTQNPFCWESARRQKRRETGDDCFQDGVHFIDYPSCQDLFSQWQLLGTKHLGFQKKTIVLFLTAPHFPPTIIAPPFIQTRQTLIDSSARTSLSFCQMLLAPVAMSHEMQVFPAGITSWQELNMTTTTTIMMRTTLILKMICCPDIWQMGRNTTQQQQWLKDGFT